MLLFSVEVFFFFLTRHCEGPVVLFLVAGEEESSRTERMKVCTCLANQCLLRAGQKTFHALFVIFVFIYLLINIIIFVVNLQQMIVFKVQMSCGKSRVKARTVVAKTCGILV